MDDLVPDYSTLPSDAKETTPPNGKLRAARLAVSLAFFVNGAGLACWVSRIPSIRHQLGLTDSQLGLAFFGLGAGALIGFPLSSVLCSRFGSRFATLAFGFVFSILLAVLPHARNLEELTLILALFGLAQGGMDVSMNSNGVEVEKLYQRSIMSALHGMFSFGGLVAAGVGLLLARQGIVPTAHFLWTAIILVGIVAFCCYRMLKVKPLGHSDHPVFAAPSKALLAIGLIVTCSFLAEGAVGDWSGVYLRDSLKTSEGFAVAGYVVYALMMTIARFSGDAILNRWGPVQVLRVFGSIAAVGFGAVLVGSPVIALLGFACIGLGLSTVVPIGFSAAGKVPGQASGTAIAAVATMGYAGFLIGPPIIGFLADQISLRWALGLVALLALVAVGLAKAVKPN